MFLTLPIIPENTSTGTIVADIVRFRGDENLIDNNYLCQYINSPECKAQILKYSKGTTRPRINLTSIKQLLIPLPSLPEQTRIASILDIADTLRQKRRHTIHLLDDLLQSVFLELFGDPMVNPQNWPIQSIEEIAANEKSSIKAGPFGSSLKKEFYVPSGYKIYGQEQVIRDNLSYGDYFIDENLYNELIAYKVKAGDILISLVGTFGKVSIVPNNFEQGIINPRLMKITLDREIIHPLYFKYVLTSNNVIKQIVSLSHGGTMGIINLKIVKRVVLPVPPIVLQRSFVQYVNDVIKVRKKILRSSKKFDYLFRSLQQRAFKGELNNDVTN